MKEYASRRELLNHIHTVSFAVDDIRLYLDTHPQDEAALSYFYEYKEKRVKALKEYASCYGPLTADTMDASSCDRWNWVNEPWPWQEGGC